MSQVTLADGDWSDDSFFASWLPACCIFLFLMLESGREGHLPSHLLTSRQARLWFHRSTVPCINCNHLANLVLSFPQDFDGWASIYEVSKSTATQEQYTVSFVSFPQGFERFDKHTWDEHYRIWEKEIFLGIHHLVKFNDLHVIIGSNGRLGSLCGPQLSSDESTPDFMTNYDVGATTVTLSNIRKLSFLKKSMLRNKTCFHEILSIIIQEWSCG